MQINNGEEYRGVGQADPSKTRAEREAELRGLHRVPGGRDVIHYYFMKYNGGLDGTMPAVGTPMIESILKHEYPNE